MQREVLVYLDIKGKPVLVGRLWARERTGRESSSFSYDPSWLKRKGAFALSPTLMLTGGQFQAQEEASRLVGLLSIVSLALMFVVLYSRYKSAVLSALIMVNIPLALVGAVIGLWLSGQPLSVAALVGFITLAGISVRNGILKVSHYINLLRFEGEHFDQKMIVRGSLERLSPVLMTALVTAFALAPLLFEAEQPGTEVLHPVAVVIFSGLISSTLLDTFLTPAMFWLFGRKPAEALMNAGARNVSAYIESLPGHEGEASVSGNVDRGRRLYVTCGNCHGRQGEGAWALNAPRLADMSDWYLVRQLHNFQHGIRGAHDADYYGWQMATMADSLKDERSINDVVAYINTLDPEPARTAMSDGRDD